ncbi:MAG: LysR family transcriptional regulator [Alphaproteobacteria bacterium]|nr:MAG: LysR family transcriptional regulator [Alphaproteobacteria bacterium]
MLKTTLNQWRIFSAVAEHGGYLQAAEKLNRSHSSLHHAVAKLQEQLGVLLLTVSGRQIELTPIGEVMQRRAAQLLEDAERLEQLAKTVHEGWETEVSIAVEGVFPSPLLTRVLKAFHAEGHETRLKLDNVILNGAVEAVLERKRDLVITPIIPQGFLGTPLMEARMIPLAHSGHPLVTASRSIETEELARSLQIVISDRAKTALPAPIGWLKSEQRWTVSDFHQAREILLSGVGFCWLPVHMFEDDIHTGRLATLNTRDQLELRVPLSLVIPSPDRLGPAGQLLADLFRKLSAEEG